MPVTLADLLTQASGQFYHLNDPLSDAQVDALFEEVGATASGPIEAREVRVEFVLGNTPYWASFLCFPIEAPPAFLPNSILRETKYAFLLAIELSYSNKWFLGVFKSNITGVEEELEDLCNAIPRRGFTRAFGGQAKYEKLSLRRMTVSRHELRASSYEANDLEVSIPSLAITRSIPSRLRLRHKQHGTISITPSSSRIHKAGPRSNVAALARLVLQVARETQKRTANEFLDAFPLSVDFSVKPKTLVPTGLLFDWWPLFELHSHELHRTNGAGHVVEVNPALLLRLLGGVLLTKKGGGEWQLVTESGLSVGRLRATNRAYLVSELANQKIRIVDSHTGAQKHLTTWVREQQAFQIAFSSPEYFYTGGQLYKRPEFDRDVQLVRSVMRPHVLLATANSEKGKPQPHSAAATVFPPNSIFRFVEDVHFAASQFLWCSDLDDEWADYIAVTTGSIAFAHCKHGKPTLGATSYQEVVGQALKNLGRVQGTPEMFEAKIKAAAANNTWGHTGIVRLRGGKLWNDFEVAAIKRL